MTMQEREKDMLSRRRSRLIDKEQRKEFDTYYGKPTADRGKSQAGKGDARRPADMDLYDAGYLMTYGETKEIRDAAKRRWYALRGLPEPEQD